MSKDLTKQDLIERYGITNVTEDGRIFGPSGKELSQSLTGPKYKKYLRIGVGDRLTRIKRSARHKYKNKIYSYDGYYYKTINLRVHRVVYAWFNDIAHSDLVIDHIDNNPFNNNLSNLQEITQKENLAKERLNKKLKEKN